MKFCFISTPTFETWDWTNPDTQGIGGSETSHIEMAQRLSRLGHDVVSYAPIPVMEMQDPFDPAGVAWANFEHLAAYARDHGVFPMNDGDIYVIYRAPELIDFVPKGAPCWLICQDVDYNREGQTLTRERIAKLTRLVPLCQTQADYFKARYPEARVSLSSNGIKRSLIEEIAGNPPERNPHRLIYASSPDRGMEQLLEIFPRLREMVPDAELHIYYGFDNIEKVVAYYGEKSRVGANTAKLRKLLQQPGVTFHGRMGQPALLREWFRSGLWVHPSNFTETSCITCMDAQACGCIPITSPVWAIGENVQHGVFIEGNAKDPLVQARYIHQTFQMMVQPELQEEIRLDMMPWALETFDWDIFARQWEGWARQDLSAAAENRILTDRETTGNAAPITDEWPAQLEPALL
jgi:glycosyltransferase involved in cell wall biosynthesis